MNEKETKHYNIIYPDYDNCIVNLISTILNAYNVQTNHNPLRQLNLNELKSKRNIVLMIFDGMGYDILKRHTDPNNSFIRSKLIDKINTVYPSTTASVITSIYTGKTPLEHGVLGWTLYYKEYFRLINILPCIDYMSGEYININSINPYKPFNLHKESIFTKIKENSPDVSQYIITENKIIDSHYNKLISEDAKMRGYSITDSLYEELRKTIKENDAKKFILTYASEPDALIHLQNTGSDWVKDYINEMDKQIRMLVDKVKGTDTLIFITADHGLIDIDKYYYNDEDEEFYNCIVLPAFPEQRFSSFFVKNHKRALFEKYIKNYENDFMFMNRDEFWKKELLGRGKKHPKIDDFIGDYLAIAIGDKGIGNFYKSGRTHEFKAHHAGLTEQEMLIPLIKIDV
ncbi:MAG: alkaline phosphatase family protein [Spirochaetota bacterium]